MPDTSEVTEFDKTTFADTLNMFRQGKIRVEPCAQVLDLLSWTKKTSKDDNWEPCFQLFSLFLRTKENKLVQIYCVFIGPIQSNDYTWPSIWRLTLLKIDLVSARHLKEISQVLKTCQDIRNTFQMQR